MRLYAIKTKIIGKNENITEIILEQLKNQRLELEDNDVIALASKIISHAEGHVIRLSDVEPSQKAKDLAKRFLLEPEFAELVLHEADKIYGGVENAILTLKDQTLAANAGIDSKNAPATSVVLWPKRAKAWARDARRDILARTGKHVGILIVDSGLVPLRLGTSGLALAVSGFEPVIDVRGEKDIFGKPIVITQHAVADDLASAAHLLIGEAAEKTPVVLIKEAPVVFGEGTYGSVDMTIPQDKCIFMSIFMNS